MVVCRALRTFVLSAALSAAAPAYAQDVSVAPAPGQADALATAAERPGVITRLRTWAADRQLMGRLNGDVDGWYPRIGGVTRGSGFAFGPGFRTPLFGNALFLDASGAISIRGYSALDARVRWLQVLDRRIELWTDLRFEDFPEEDFFGIGMDSPETARTSYDLDGTNFSTRAVFRPHRAVRLTATGGYLRPDVGPGGDTAFPSIEERFTDTQSPALIEQPHYAHTSIAGEIDYRDTGGNTSRGGYYRSSFGFWNDVNLDRYDFRRFDAQLMQFVPITPGGAHVLSGRIGANFLSSTDGHRVPFFFLPYVGGSDTIRSFREFRFKDENALWFSGEYKWRLKSYLSVSVFADAGEVAPTWRSFTFTGMRAGYGAGVALHTANRTALRVDVGTGGGEGWQLFLKFKPVF
jgi:hypothetical protein